MANDPGPRWSPGDIVVHRAVETLESARMVHAIMGDPAGSTGGQPFLAGGRILTVLGRPYRVIKDNHERTVLYQPEGTALPRWLIAEGRYLPNPQISGGESVRLLYPGKRYDITLFFETENNPPWYFDALFLGEGLGAGWRQRRRNWEGLDPSSAPRQTRPGFRGWYVNIQAPFWRRPYGFDVVDLTLDLVVRPDLTWYWKDEDELALAIETGACSPRLANDIRRGGEEVVRLIESRDPPFDGSWLDWHAPADWRIDVLPDGWQHENALIDE